jgi:hypothetical protein
MEQIITEPYARSIFMLAIMENRSAELLDALFDGGSVTLDEDQRKLTIVSGAQLRALTRDNEVEPEAAANG